MVYYDPDSTSPDLRVYRAIVPDLRPILATPVLDPYGMGIFVLHIDSLTPSPYILETSTNMVDWEPLFTNYWGGSYDYFDYDSMNHDRDSIGW